MKLFGIIYGDKKTEFDPYVIQSTEKRWRFENQAMIEIMENPPADAYIGIFSWKFPYKTGISKDELHKITSPILTGKSFPGIMSTEKVDVLNFSRPIAVPNFMEWSEEGHKGIKGFIQACCVQTGMAYTNDPKHIVYANQFIAKRSVYIAYVNDIIKPCLELLEGPLWEQVNQDAGYTKALEKPLLKKFTGLDFYNYVPFILERLMMQYIDNKNLLCLDLNK